MHGVKLSQCFHKAHSGLLIPPPQGKCHGECRHPSLRGVGRCNAATALWISPNWVSGARGLFQARWLCLHQLLHCHWIGFSCQSCLSPLFKKMGQGTASEGGVGSCCGFTFLPETQRLGQCLSQSRGTPTQDRHSSVPMAEDG